MREIGAFEAKNRLGTLLALGGLKIKDLVEEGRR